MRKELTKNKPEKGDILYKGWIFWRSAVVDEKSQYFSSLTLINPN